MEHACLCQIIGPILMKKNLLCQARKNSGQVFQTKAFVFLQGAGKIRFDPTKARTMAIPGLFTPNYLLTLFAYQTT